MTVELPDEPVNRKETYLADIAGQDVELPDEPVNRIEAYLAYIAENGGGTGNKDVEFVDLTITSVAEDGIIVSASEYLDELTANADKKFFIFRMVIPDGSGLPLAGTIQLPLFWYAAPGLATANTTVFLGNTLQNIMFAYEPINGNYHTKEGKVVITPIGA